MPLTRCIATDPSFSSPIDGRERVRAGEPFSLGLRRDADEALILGRFYLTFYDFDAGTSQVDGSELAIEMLQMGPQATHLELPRVTEIRQCAAHRSHDRAAGWPSARAGCALAP